MPLLSLIVTLIVIGVVLWLVSLLPIDARIKQIIQGVTLIVIILWLLTLFVPSLATFRVGG